MAARVAFALIVCSLAISSVAGISCYVCAASGEDTENSTCVANPEEIKVPCPVNDKYCTIERGYENGQLHHFTRGCATNPLKINETKTTVIAGTVHFRHFYACRDNFCNGGDGIIDEEPEVLWCYDCLGFEEGSECVRDPASNSSYVYACPIEYHCIIQRIEYKGKLRSVWRSYASNPEHINQTITDGRLITHYTSCDASFCNDGDGVVEPVEWKEPSSGGLPGYAIGIIIGVSVVAVGVALVCGVIYRLYRNTKT